MSLAMAVFIFFFSVSEWVVSFMCAQAFSPMLASWGAVVSLFVDSTTSSETLWEQAAFGNLNGGLGTQVLGTSSEWPSCRMVAGVVL